MTINIHIPATLRAYCHDDTKEINVSAATVRAALEQLAHNRVSLYESICDETGAVRRHVHLFVNDSLLRGDAGLDTELQPGDTLTIMPAVSGG